MPKKSPSVRKIRLFVASPGDVTAERDHLKRVVDEINTTVAPVKKCVVELVRWETHVNPGMGRPQGIINSQIGSYDIFLGIMWRRFGTPTGVADSGTEEEFRIAYKGWKADPQTPILFYFNQAPFSPRTEEELQQFASVLRFRKELESRGLVWEYRDSADFPEIVRPQLSRIIIDLPDEGEEFVSHPTSPKTPPPIRVFIGSSSEGLRTARQIKEALQKMGVQTALWSDEFTLMESYVGTLYRVLDECNALVMVFTPDDLVTTRGATHAAPHENLIYELGLFHGRHGRNRTFVLATDDVNLPSDLAGIVYLRFDANRPKPVLNQLRRQLLTITKPTAA